MHEPFRIRCGGCETGGHLAEKATNLGKSEKIQANHQENLIFFQENHLGNGRNLGHRRRAAVDTAKELAKANAGRELLRAQKLPGLKGESRSNQEVTIGNDW